MVFHVNNDGNATISIKRILSKLQNGIIQMIAPQVKHRSISNKDEHTFVNNALFYESNCVGVGVGEESLNSIVVVK